MSSLDTVSAIPSAAPNETGAKLEAHRGAVSVEVVARELKKTLKDTPLGKLDLSKTNVNALIRLLSRVDSPELSSTVVDSYLASVGNYNNNWYVFGNTSRQSAIILAGDSVTGLGLGYTSNWASDRAEQEQVFNAILAYRQDGGAKTVIAKYATALESWVGVVWVAALEDTAKLTKSADITAQKAAEWFSSMYQEGILNRDGFVTLYSRVLSKPDGMVAMAKFLGIKATDLPSLWTEYQKDPAKYAPRLRFVVEQAAAMKQSLDGSGRFNDRNLLSVLKGDFLKDAEKVTDKLSVGVDAAMDKALTEAKTKAADGTVDPKERAAIQAAINSVEQNRETFTRKAVSHVATNFFALAGPKWWSALGASGAFDVSWLTVHIGALATEGGKFIPTIAVPLHTSATISKTAESTTTLTAGPTVGYASHGFITLDGTLTNTKNIQFIGAGMQEGTSSSVGVSVGKGFWIIMISNGERRLNTIENYTASVANVFADALVNSKDTTVNESQLKAALKGNGLSDTGNMANIVALKDALNRYTTQLGMPADASPGLRVMVANQAARFMLEQLVADEAANTKENKSFGGVSFGLGVGPGFLLPIFGFNLYDIKQAYVKTKALPIQWAVTWAPVATTAADVITTPASPAEEIKAELDIKSVMPNLLDAKTIHGMKELFLAMRSNKDFQTFQKSRTPGAVNPQGVQSLIKALNAFVKLPNYKAAAIMALSQVSNRTVTEGFGMDDLDQTLSAANALTSGDQLSRKVAEALTKKNPLGRDLWIKNNPKTVNAIRQNRLASAVASNQFPESKAIFQKIYAPEAFKKALSENPVNLKDSDIAFVGYDQKLGAAKGVDMLPVGANIVGKMLLSDASPEIVIRLVSLFEQKQANRFNRWAIHLENLINGTQKWASDKASPDSVALFKRVLIGETITLPNGRVIVGKKPDVYASLAVINGAACYNAVLGFTPKGYTIITPAKPGNSTPAPTPIEVPDVFADVFTPQAVQNTVGFGAAVFVDTSAPVVPSPLVPWTPSPWTPAISTTPVHWAAAQTPGASPAVATPAAPISSGSASRLPGWAVNVGSNVGSQVVTPIPAIPVITPSTSVLWATWVTTNLWVIGARTTIPLGMIGTLPNLINSPNE